MRAGIDFNELPAIPESAGLANGCALHCDSPVWALRACSCLTVQKSHTSGVGSGGGALTVRTHRRPAFAGVGERRLHPFGLSGSVLGQAARHPLVDPADVVITVDVAVFTTGFAGITSSTGLTGRALALVVDAEAGPYRGEVRPQITTSPRTAGPLRRDPRRLNDKLAEPLLGQRLSVRARRPPEIRVVPNEFGHQLAGRNERLTIGPYRIQIGEQSTIPGGRLRSPASRSWASSARPRSISSSAMAGQRPSAATATRFSGRHFSLERPMHPAGSPPTTMPLTRSRTVSANSSISARSAAASSSISSQSLSSTVPSRSGMNRMRNARERVSSGRFGELPAIATGAKVGISSTAQPPPLVGTRTGRVAPRRYPLFKIPIRSATPGLSGRNDRSTSSRRIVRTPFSRSRGSNAGDDNVAACTGFHAKRYR